MLSETDCAALRDMFIALHWRITGAGAFERPATQAAPSAGVAADSRDHDDGIDDQSHVRMSDIACDIAISTIPTSPIASAAPVVGIDLLAVPTSPPE
jgi:hypothetical protein